MIDCHGQFQHFSNLHYKYNPEETAIIILGDVGLNFNLDHNDDDRKKYLSSFGYRIYCVRGNHEYRPEQLPEGTVYMDIDPDIDNYVWYDAKYPNIRYLIDNFYYIFDNCNALIIGGAYSVDAPFRKEKGWMWNPEEQLSETERKNVLEQLKIRKNYDLILSHTCPRSWQPIDLFMGRVDQSTVDTSMEDFLEEVADRADWKAWCWGHFHETREYSELESKPCRKRLMIFQDFIPLKEIVN